jgi:hypothetical protein
MKETPKRKTTVTSSLIEISKVQLGNRVVVRGGGGDNGKDAAHERPILEVEVLI